MIDTPILSDPFLERERLKYTEPIASRECILALLNQTPEAPMTELQIAQQLRLDEETQRVALRKRLGAMVRDGQLIRNRRGKYFSGATLKQVAGVVVGNREGFGFLKIEGYPKDLFLSHREMTKCLSGDRVLAQILPKIKGREEAKILEILELRNPSIVAYFYLGSDGKGYLRPYNLELTERFEVVNLSHWSAKNEQWVLAQIVERSGKRRLGRCVIEKAFGENEQIGVGCVLALAEHQITTDWPTQVKTAVSALSDVSTTVSQDRRDLTALPFFTIDGACAKDLDDAVYCCPTEKGWKLRVAIADVSHYVTANGPIDQEAQQRGTSVYFDHCVVPMLPPKLSNDLCSLLPDVNRLAFVCEMDIDTAGELKRYTFYEAIIRSRRRLTYEQAQLWLDGQLGNRYSEETLGIQSVLQHLSDLYQARIAQKNKRGAIHFRLEEIMCLYDAHGMVRQISPAGLLSKSHGIIEESMILANIASAKAILSHKVVGLHRVHEKPDLNRLKELLHFLKTFPRFKALCGTKPFSMRLLRDVLEQTRSTQDAAWIHTLVLRTMRPACYTIKPEGHFGLALRHYTHFTSPIRRYPDLLVHRTLKSLYLSADRDPRSAQSFVEASELSGLAAQATRLEKRAEKASREASEWLKYQYLTQQTDIAWSGVILNVTPQGLTIRLTDLLTEGFLPIAHLPTDQYVYMVKNFSLRGQTTGQHYQMGDSLKVFVQRVDFLDRMILLGFAP